jgi:xanthine dehydrogenase small subunit
MVRNIKFILNNELVEAEVNPAAVILDFIRDYHLTGTKEGCKEGDCGACTVLVGELQRGLNNNEVVYKSINSCLFPLGNVHGKHIVTIEGVNQPGKALTPIQQAFVEEGASQCGFCTPGFIISLTGYLISSDSLVAKEALYSMDGNICRCTGHNSIIRAAEKITSGFGAIENTNGTKMKFLTDNKFLPEYFLTIKERLSKIEKAEFHRETQDSSSYFVSGGSDLFVQIPDLMMNANVKFLYDSPEIKFIKEENGYILIGSTSTVNDVLNSKIMLKYFPSLFGFIELFGSLPIRNSATIGGNLNNASPIGDMTSFFLGLNSTVVLADPDDNQREIPLCDYYLSYKKTARNGDEYMKYLYFKIPLGRYYFNFEKVSKRTYLDIASVNSTILIETDGDIINDVHISAGGVFATPLYLRKTREFLLSKSLSIETIKGAVEISETEIAPISDARGEADYKKLLLKRLIFSHFIKLFPELISIKDTVG